MEPTIIRVRRFQPQRWVAHESDGTDSVWFDPSNLATHLADRGYTLPPGVDLMAMRPGDEFVPEPKPAPEPLPERWCNVYRWGHATRARADAVSVDGRVAVVHVWSDSDGDHAVIERVTE